MNEEQLWGTARARPGTYLEPRAREDVNESEGERQQERGGVVLHGGVRGVEVDDVAREEGRQAEADGSKHALLSIFHFSAFA